MITARQRILWASLLASATFAVSAQTPPPPAVPAGPQVHAEQRAHTPRDGKFVERMQERRVKHMAELKAELKLNASQESAWSNFESATKPPAQPAQRMDRKAARAEFEKLSTPQRLDRMQARQSERAARFALRADATRSFYAVLSPEQQKTFDAKAMPHGPHGKHRGHGHGPAHRSPPPAKG